MKGIEIARKLNISTSALRHYEAWGLLPEVERSANGYRLYTGEHEAYFRCIRAMQAGFGMSFVRRIMPMVISGRKLEVLWLINKAQAALHEERESIGRTIDMLELTELADLPRYRGKPSFTIGEAAKETLVAPSAIRHWELEGLIRPARHPESGFRIYSLPEIRKLLVIRIVQRAAYSLDIVRGVLAELDNQNAAQARKIALASLRYMDDRLVGQLRGMAALQHLFNVIEAEGS